MISAENEKEITVNNLTAIDFDFKTGEISQDLLIEYMTIIMTIKRNIELRESDGALRDKKSYMSNLYLIS